MRLEALRGSERRVVRIVGMVGLTLDETPHVCLVDMFADTEFSYLTIKFIMIPLAFMFMIEKR